jgi:L-alanine-DL-glutamate epimerase-like enolase superfamily enzyme
MISFDAPSAMAEEALEVHALHGIETFKVKVGRDVATDVAACAAIREALPGADLYVDGNRGWTYAQAVAAGDALAELGVRAIEEPIGLEDRAGRRALAERWRVPLIGDESCISLADTVAAVEDGAVGMVSVKTARTGFTASRRILGYCQGRSVPVLVGSQYEAGAGALASLAFACGFAATGRRPAELTNVLDLDDDVLAVPLDIRDGRVAASTAPGLGIAIDEDKLAHYRLDERVAVGAG